MFAAPRSARFRSSSFDVVVIAGSTGAIEAVGKVLASLPGDFPVPIAVALHIGAHLKSNLPPLLRHRTRLDVKWAEDGERVRAGTVYVAPPDRHLELQHRLTCRLSAAPRVNFTRPAADPLFVSASVEAGPRVLGVVLSGWGSDGAAGAQHIKQAAGTVIAQHPETTIAPAMPRSAIAADCADYVLPLDVVAPALVTLVMVPGAAQHFGVGAA